MFFNIGKVGPGVSSIGTDFDCIKKGYISVTPLSIDMTDHILYKKLRKNMNLDKAKGSGLTSQTIRKKLAEELKHLGIKNEEVIDFSVCNAQTLIY